MIRRLSAELARHLPSGGDPDTGVATAWVAAATGPPGGGSGGSSGMGEPPPLPPWMGDAKFLNPLLAAYDARVRELEEDAAARGASARAIEAEVRLGAVGCI